MIFLSLRLTLQAMSPGPRLSADQAAILLDLPNKPLTEDMF
jgi:hypothetical protein